MNFKIVFFLSVFICNLSFSQISVHRNFNLELAERDSLKSMKLEEFKKGRKSSIKRHFSYYVMNAFLCEETMKKKGFDGVLKLAYSGEGGEQFFKNLKEVLDIDENNFHQTIVRLINKG